MNQRMGMWNDNPPSYEDSNDCTEKECYIVWYHTFPKYFDAFVESICEQEIWLPNDTGKSDADDLTEQDADNTIVGSQEQRDCNVKKKFSPDSPDVREHSVGTNEN